MTTPTPTIACIANNGANGELEVPLWMCPCKECTKMDWDLARSLDGDGEVGTLKAWRHESFPEHWDANGRPR